MRGPEHQSRYLQAISAPWFTISVNLHTFLQPQLHQSILAHASDVILAGILPERPFLLTLN
jgi:hypothetical protein